MKSLSTAQAKFVSGGFSKGSLAATRVGPIGAATESAPALQAAAESDDSLRQMAPPRRILGRYPPSMRFDAARTAPRNTDDDNYDGFNDQGGGV